jgi:hypothetical protein
MDAAPAMMPHPRARVPQHPDELDYAGRQRGQPLDADLAQRASLVWADPGVNPAGQMIGDLVISREPVCSLTVNL